MKKIKFLLPIISASVLPATIIPTVASCGQKSLVTLEEAKAISKGKIEDMTAEAIGRQPEATEKLKAACIMCVKELDKTTHYAQALGLGYCGFAMEAIGRQPEESDHITEALVVVINLVLSQPNEKGYALGYGAEGFYEAIGRQPEAYSELLREYLDYAYQVINS